MRDANGEEFPDPPDDPAERAWWKMVYYTRLYGQSRESMREYLQMKEPLATAQKVLMKVKP